MIRHGDDLAGPFPARAVGEVLRPRYVLAPDADGKPALWHRHSVERDRDFGGSVGLCLSVRRDGASEWTWIQATTVTAEFYGRREADEALVQAQHDALPFWASTGGAE